MGWHAYNIPSIAMTPTLLLGDQLFCDSGLPGDRIQMKGGIRRINRQPVERRRIGDYVIARSARKATLYEEALPEGRRHEIIEYSDNSPVDNTPEFLVPADSYFAMGDDRDDSLDSRTQLEVRDRAGTIRPRDEPGWYVSRSSIVCRVNYVYWSGFDRRDRIGMALK